jgi:serine/threonine-protein kinase RsbT
VNLRKTKMNYMAHKYSGLSLASTVDKEQIRDRLLSGKPHLLPLRSSLDAVVARATVRKLADAVGYRLADQARLSTALYEVARSIVDRAGQGQIVISWREEDSFHQGLECTCHDYGLSASRSTQVLKRGDNLEKADSSYPALERLVDKLEVTKSSLRGSCVSVIKWLS